MVHALKDTPFKGSLGKAAVSTASFLMLLSFFLFFYGFTIVAADHDDLKLDGLEGEKEKMPYSLVEITKKGIKVTSISVRDNSSGKVEKVESDAFPEAQFFGKLKIKGFGKNKVLLSDDVKTYDLSMETPEHPKLPFHGDSAGEIPSTSPVQESRAEPLKRAVAYFKSLDLEGLIVHSGALLLILFLIIVLCVAIVKKMRILFSPADDAEAGGNDDDFSDDYEPDAAELERIEQRQALKEKLAKSKIVDIFVEDGKITPERARQALQKERETTRKAELILADEKKVTLQEVYQARARKYGMEFLDLAGFSGNEDSLICKRALGVVPYGLANDSVIFPYRINRHRKILYFLHCSEPTSSLEDDIKRETGGYYSKFSLANEEDLKVLIGKMKNYFVLEEKFKLEDIMDPTKKKKIKERQKKKEVKLTLAKLAFYIFATIAVSILGFNAFVLNSPQTILTARVDECMKRIMAGDFDKVFDYLDSRSRQVFDTYTLPKQFGITDSSSLVYARIFDIVFDESKKSAEVKWVATRNRDGSPARSEEVSRWVIENGKWVMDITGRLKRF